MSAFGRRQGLGSGAAGRPAFGVARPMHGPGPTTRPDPDSPAPGGGGSQFPSLSALEGAIAAPGTAADAMQRLAERQAASIDPTPARGEGFEASIHRIKEQVLPRLLERVDPEAAATLGKDELAEEIGRAHV